MANGTNNTVLCIAKLPGKYENFTGTIDTAYVKGTVYEAFFLIKDDGSLVFKSGVWEDGVWKKGTWKKGYCQNKPDRQLFWCQQKRQPPGDGRNDTL